MAKLFDMFKQQLFPKFFKSVFKKEKKKLEFKGTKNKNKIMGSFVDNNFEA